MTRKKVYAVPECELLVVKFEEGFLDSIITGGKASAEKVTVDSGSWDD